MSTESAQYDERRSILELVAAGKLSVADAAEQIAAAGVKSDAPAMAEVPAEKPVTAKAPQAESQMEVEESLKENGDVEKGRWLHIHVSDTGSGKSRVRLQLPLSFLNFGLKIGSRFAPELQQFNLKEMAEELSSMEKGILVDVVDDEGGEHVRIFVD
jgi:hypothetical protein